MIIINTLKIWGLADIMSSFPLPHYQLHVKHGNRQAFAIHVCDGQAISNYSRFYPLLPTHYHSSTRFFDLLKSSEFWLANIQLCLKKTRLLFSFTRMRCSKEESGIAVDLLCVYSDAFIVMCLW
ncbi:hypothetical protein BsWGS_07547 [Bradybaena similaris]